MEKERPGGVLQETRTARRTRDFRRTVSSGSIKGKYSLRVGYLNVPTGIRRNYAHVVGTPPPGGGRGARGGEICE